MMHRYSKHYSREEARDLLPQIRKWLDQLDRCRNDLQECDQRMTPLLAAGDELGGEVVNRFARGLADLKDLLHEFQVREIQLKDLERGLIDFPAIVAGREVFLCWERDEEDIEFWHDLDTGYAGRERLT